MEKNKIKIIGTVLSIIGVVLILFGLYIIFIEKVPNNNQTDSSDNGKDEKNVVRFNGVYQNGDNIIKLYQKENGALAYNISYNNGYGEVSSICDITGESATDEIFETYYRIILKGNDIELSSNNEELTSGIYSKISDYTMNDYYNDNYGDAKYVDTKYNGEYNLEKTKAYLYQKNENEVRVYIQNANSSFDLVFEIDNNGVLSCEHFDDIYEITIDDNGFTYKVIQGDVNDIEGTYTKVKTLTMKEILNIFY